MMDTSDTPMPPMPNYDDLAKMVEDPLSPASPSPLDPPFPFSPSPSRLARLCPSLSLSPYSDSPYSDSDPCAFQSKKFPSPKLVAIYTPTLCAFPDTIYGIRSL